ncbi:MAG: hypothetical protein HZA08_07450 [Nitrospirae bacterium]|nr:hypothetical protein [Nitrospirota bacterium]
MRTLLYVPVIHTRADLGSLAKDIAERGTKDLGEEPWRRHEGVVNDFWDTIINYFESIEVSGFKIYQDGMLADGEMGQKIVEEGVKSGSKNYEIVSRLLQKGAILVRTEELALVSEERDRLIKITRAKTVPGKLLLLIVYKLTKNRLLKKRDIFISRRIAETLNQDETGILFIGAYHNVKKRLPIDINIIEIKDTAKVREYQMLLPFYNKHKHRMEKLSKYLISEIK